MSFFKRSPALPFKNKKAKNCPRIVHREPTVGLTEQMTIRDPHGSTRRCYCITVMEVQVNDQNCVTHFTASVVIKELVQQDFILTLVRHYTEILNFTRIDAHYWQCSSDEKIVVDL